MDGRTDGRRDLPHALASPPLPPEQGGGGSRPVCVSSVCNANAIAPSPPSPSPSCCCSPPPPPPAPPHTKNLTGRRRRVGTAAAAAAAAAWDGRCERGSDKPGREGGGAKQASNPQGPTPEIAPRMLKYIIFWGTNIFVKGTFMPKKLLDRLCSFLHSPAKPTSA